MSRPPDAHRARPGWVNRPPGAAVPEPARLLAAGAGLVLLGASASVFYHVADVAGGLSWLVASVGGSLALATLAAWRTSTRGCLALGAGLLVAGVVAYLALVPELHDDLLTVGFAARWLEYLTGVTVLEFRRAGLWAAAVAPAPTFLGWSLLLGRRYDAAALVGGAMLAYFALTGDAGATTTLVGMAALLVLLGAGTVDLDGGTLREVQRVGFVAAVAVLAARWFRLVPRAGALSPGVSGGGGGDGDDLATVDRPFEGDLDRADERAHIRESISLSPRVLFTVEAGEPAYWRVGAYDRYSGDDWVRTGGTGPYAGPLDGPPGPARTVGQVVDVERRVETLPSAWKPTSAAGIDPGRLAVSDLDGLLAAAPLEPGERYEVTSELPDREPARLRAAGTDYPAAVRERYLGLPASMPGRVGELAADVVADAETPYDAAVAVARWLAAEKTYDLEVDRPDGDAVDAFLFSMDRGYCVYFASAMVVMLRSVDVPARFVLGFAPGQRVGETRWVLRGLDSHAWAEVYFPTVGWVRFDPTPGLDRRLVRQQYLDAARAADVDGVDTNESRSARPVGDPTALEELPGIDTATGTVTETDATGPNATADATGAMGSSPGSAGPAGPGARGNPVGTWLRGRDRLSLLAGAVGVGLGLHWVGAVDRGLRVAKVRWQRPTGSPRRDAERAFERLELHLAGTVRPRRPGETRRDYLAAAAGGIDEERVRRVLDLAERASFGGGVTRAEADEAIRTVDAIVAGGSGP